jgi:bifunctional NMN adenylyltransferase/nudix hydrolase
MQKISKPYDLVIYIGRMQPPTLAHIANVKTAIELSKKVLVLFGSSFQPRTIKNPWSWHERATMLINQLEPADTPSVSCRGIHDYRYNDQEWAQQVQRLVKQEIIGIDKPKIGIIGCKKDSSSYYLDMFPQWKFIEMEQIEDVNATAIREEYFTGRLFQWHDKDFISKPLQDFLRQWSKAEQYSDLVTEFEFVKKYKSAWEKAPYPPIFVTTDAAIIQSGHILLVQRKAAPGKGLWALPGGFLNQDETVTVGVLRELREETKLKVPTAVLAGSMVARHVFDHPGRSLRGRTITHAFAFVLPNGELSKVKGGDDATKAKWFPLDDALEMEEFLFEDHIDIIRFAKNACDSM